MSIRVGGGPGGGGSGSSQASGVAVAPTGNIASTDVQSALAELDTEKADAAATTAALAAKAPLASPALTGTPTAPTAAQGTNTTQVATTAFTRAEIAALVNSAPGTLDTLGEIATQLASDESTAAALATTVGTKAPLASPAFTGTPTAPTPAASDNSTKLATTAYVDTASGLLVPKSLVDAKGDLLVATADNTVGRLGVGSDGQVLTADTASAGGVKWATPASSGGVDYWRSGNYNYPFPSSGALTTLVPFDVNYVYWCPFLLTVSKTFDRIAAYVTMQAASGQVRLGIYTNSGGVPANLVVDAGQTSGATLGLKEATLTGVTLTPDLYWLAVVMQTNYPTITAYPANTNVPYFGFPNGPVSGLSNTQYRSSGVSGAFPSSAPAVNNVSSNIPALMLRAA